MFQLAYTEDILAEVLYHIRRNNVGLTGTQITIIRDQIAATMDRRISRYPSGEDALHIGDPFDRHLHAAAVAGAMDCIITDDAGFTGLSVNQRDLLEYEIYTADEFLTLVDDSSPSTVVVALHRQIEHRSRRPGASFDFVERLVAANCPSFAGRVKRHCQQLALRKA